MRRSIRLGAVVLAALSLPLALDAIRAAAQTAGTSATLLWTAPGDDGTVGRASQYALRYSTTAPAGTDTLSWWNGATVFTMTGKVPAVAGAADSVVVTGLASGTRYYFILRAADEVPNWSGYSNVAIVDTRDVVAPIRVTDLRPR